MTPDELAKVRRLADGGDPFFRGAIWMLNHLTHAPGFPGASPTQEDTMTDQPTTPGPTDAQREELTERTYNAMTDLSIDRDRWNARLDVFRAALAAVPSGTSNKGGIIGALVGETTKAPSVTDALRVSRFVADEYRDIAGVDVPDPQD